MLTFTVATSLTEVPGLAGLLTVYPPDGAVVIEVEQMLKRPITKSSSCEVPALPEERVAMVTVVKQGSWPAPRPSSLLTSTPPSMNSPVSIELAPPRLALSWYVHGESTREWLVVEQARAFEPGASA